MAWVATAVIGSSVIGGLISSDSSRSASNKQLDASEASNALQKNMYDQTVARNAPFVSGGVQSFNALLDRLGLSGNTSAPGYGSFGKAPTAQDVMNEPGYQFGLQQGQANLDRKLNAQGRTYGGNALAAAARYGNDYASGQYNNAFNRLQSGNQQAYNQLGNVANLGQNAANNTGQAGANYATQAGANLQGGANAAAANSLAQGNIWTNAINQGVSAYRNQPSIWQTPVDAQQGGYNDQNGSDIGWYPGGP